MMGVMETPRGCGSCAVHHRSVAAAGALMPTSRAAARAGKPTGERVRATSRPRPASAGGATRSPNIR